MIISFSVLVSVIPYANGALKMYQGFTKNKLIKELNEEVKNQTIILDELKEALLMENYAEYHYTWERLKALERPQITFEEYLTEVNMIQDAFYKTLGKWSGKSGKKRDDYMFMSHLNICIAYTFLLKGELLNVADYLENAVVDAQKVKKLIYQELDVLTMEMRGTLEKIQNVEQKVDEGLNTAKLGMQIAFPVQALLMKVVASKKNVEVDELANKAFKQLVTEKIFKLSNNEKIESTNALNSKIDEIDQSIFQIVKVKEFVMKKVSSIELK